MQAIQDFQINSSETEPLVEIKKQEAMDYLKEIIWQDGIKQHILVALDEIMAFIEQYIDLLNDPSLVSNAKASAENIRKAYKDPTFTYFQHSSLDNDYRNIDIAASRILGKPELRKSSNETIERQMGHIGLMLKDIYAEQRNFKAIALAISPHELLDLITSNREMEYAIKKSFRKVIGEIDGQYVITGKIKKFWDKIQNYLLSMHRNGQEVFPAKQRIQIENEGRKYPEALVNALMDYNDFPESSLFPSGLVGEDLDALLNKNIKPRLRKRILFLSNFLFLLNNPIGSVVNLYTIEQKD